MWRARLARSLVQRSGWFDAEFYLEEYPDVAAAGDDPLAHYCTHGWREARRPGPMVHPACFAASPVGQRFVTFNPIIVWMVLGRWLDWPLSWPELRNWSPKAEPAKSKLAIVVHETTRTGAPVFALRLARWLRRCGGTETLFVLLNDGSLLPEIWSEFDCLPLFAIPHKHRAEYMQTQLGGLSLLYLNSLASLRAWEWLDWHDGALLLHVHESPATLPSYSAALAPVAAAGPCVIAVNDACHVPLTEAVGTQPHIVPPAIEAASALPDRCGKAPPIVVGCGTISRRKGADLFCEVVAKIAEKLQSEVEFLWIGGPGDVPMTSLLENHGVAGKVRLAGEVADPLPLLSKASLLLLPSREDPFPLVALEAASCGVPVVCFDALADGVGGFISGGAGEMVPAFDVEAMADAAVRLLVDSGWHRSASDAAARAVEQFRIDTIGLKIGKIMNQLVGYRLVSHAECDLAADC